MEVNVVGQVVRVHLLAVVHVDDMSHRWHVPQQALATANRDHLRNRNKIPKHCMVEPCFTITSVI